MPKKEKYQNVHTGEIKELEKVEIVEDNPQPIRVFVFTDGDRWQWEQFLKYWKNIT